MPTNDPFEQRMYRNQVKRNEDKVLALAEHIHEYAGYLVREVREGRISTSGQYANTISADVAELLRRVSVLDALKDFDGVFASEPANTDTPDA
jgi:hypothetical protein